MLDDTTRVRLNLLMDDQMDPTEAADLSLAAEADNDAKRFLDRQYLVREVLRSHSKIPVMRNGLSLADNVSLALQNELALPQASPEIARTIKTAYRFEKSVSLALAASLVAIAVYVGQAMQSDTMVDTSRVATLAGDRTETTQASMEAALDPYILMHTQSAEHLTASMLPFMRVASYH